MPGDLRRIRSGGDKDVFVYIARSHAINEETKKKVWVAPISTSPLGSTS